MNVEKLLLESVSNSILMHLVNSDVHLISQIDPTYDFKKGFLKTKFKILKPWYHNEDFHLFLLRDEVSIFIDQYQISKHLYVGVSISGDYFELSVGLKDRDKENQQVIYGLGLIERLIVPK